MMISPLAKDSGLVPHSEIREGTAKGEVIMRKRLNNQRKGNILRVGAWNAGNLNVVGKLENLKREMQRLDLDLVGVSAVKWKEDRDFW